MDMAMPLRIRRIMATVMPLRIQRIMAMVMPLRTQRIMAMVMPLRIRTTVMGTQLPMVRTRMKKLVAVMTMKLVPLNDGSSGDHMQPRSRNPPNRSYSSGDGSRKGGGRYRRRGSVTKYSLNTAEEVKKEYDEHEDLINKFRTQAQVGEGTTNANSDASNELSDSGESNDNDLDDATKKGLKKKTKRFRKFGGRRGSTK
eukprot:scaffold321_cov95-Cylindrotheca_fusiformis.AAC.1